MSESEYVAGPSNMNIEKKSLVRKSKKVSKKTEKEPVVERDANEGYPGLKIKLFEHQLVSVKEMEKREDVRFRTCTANIPCDDSPFGKPITMTFESNMGILADIPGYGKSLSMVGLLCRDQMEWDVSKPHIYSKNFDPCRDHYRISHCSYTNVVLKYEVPRLSASLLLCSPSVLPQWEEYFGYSKLKVTSIKTKNSIIDLNPNDWDVVMVVPSMYRGLIAKWEKYAWKRFIYDDPTQCHVPNSNPVIAGFTWFISATYMNNMYGMFPNSSWLHKLFCSIPDWQYRAMVVKNSDAFVRASFRMPPITVHKHKCHNPQAVNAVEEFVSEEVAQMLAAGDVSGAIEKIGGKNTNGNLMEAVLEKHKAEKNDLTHEYVHAQSIPSNDPRYGYYKKRATELEQKIKEVDRKIECMKERFDGVLKEPCSICTDELTKPVLLPCCQHIFCGGCALGWLQTHRNCPMCRSPVALSKLVYVSDNDGRFAVNKEASKPVDIPSKPDTFIKILKEIMDKSEDNRVILFSQYDETFDVARRYLDDAHIDYAEIKGATGTRKKKIEKYKKGETKVLFLNALYNGAGINLQNTTHIIMYHTMNNQLYDQIIGRAMRIGRTSDLVVHILE